VHYTRGGRTPTPVQCCDLWYYTRQMFFSTRRHYSRLPTGARPKTNRTDLKNRLNPRKLVITITTIHRAETMYHITCTTIRQEKKTYNLLDLWPPTKWSVVISRWLLLLLPFTKCLFVNRLYEKSPLYNYISSIGFTIIFHQRILPRNSLYR